MLCGDRQCNCAIQSSTLAISGDGSGETPYVIEQAEFSDLQELQDNVANLLARTGALEAWRSTAEGQIATLATQMANRMQIRQSSQSLPGPVTTSGAAASTLHSIAVPAPGIPGQYLVWGQYAWTQTVGGDVFQIRLSSPIVNGGQNTGGTGHRARALFVVLIAPNGGLDPFQLETEVFRQAGSGTASFSATTANRLGRLFIPSPA